MKRLTPIHAALLFAWFLVPTLAVAQDALPIPPIPDLLAPDLPAEPGTAAAPTPVTVEIPPLTPPGTPEKSKPTKDREQPPAAPVVPPSDKPATAKGTEKDNNKETKKDGKAAAKPPVPLTINLTGARSGPMCASMIVLTHAGKPVPGTERLIINGTATLPLPAGTYSFAAKGGARIQPSMRIFEVSQESSTLNVALADYAPVWQAGWKQASLYFSPGPAGENAYTRIEEIRLAARARGVDLVACDGLWRLRNAAGNAYLELPDGKRLLNAALDAAAEEGTLLVQAWGVRRPGLGNLLVWEPSPVLGPDEEVPNTALYPALETIRQRGAVSAFCLPTGLSASGQPSAELVFDTIAGPLYDLLDISRGGDDLNVWWTLLNQGYRIPACSGADSAFVPGSAPEFPPLGTYQLQPRSRPTPPLFLNALRSGQTVVSNGPFLWLFVQRPEAAANTDAAAGEGSLPAGQYVPIGSVTRPSALRRQIFLEAYSCSDPADSIRRIELIYNGEVIRNVNFPRPGQKSAQSRWNDVILDHSGWLIARYYSHASHLWAFTNPIYVSDSVGPQPAGAFCTINVEAAGKPLTALVEALNFGNVIGRWQTGLGPLQIRVPATVQLRASAPGYESATLGVYEDGGAAAFIADLRRSNKLGLALQDADTYRLLRQKLENSAITFRLEPKAP